MSYLKNFEIIKEYDKIYLTDNTEKILKFINNLENKILVLDIGQKDKKINNSLSKNIKCLKIPFSILNKNYTDRWEPHKKSFDNIEKIYEVYKKKNSFFFNIVKVLFHDDRKDLLFKKKIILKTEKFFFYEKIFNIIKVYNKNVCLKIFDQYCLDTKLELQNLNLFEDKKFLEYFIEDGYKKNYANNLKFFFIIMLYPIYAILKVKSICFHKNFGFNDAFFLRMYSEGYGINKNKNFLSEDWLFDQSYFKKNNTFFVLETPVTRSKINLLKEKKIKFIHANIKNPLDCIDIKDLLQLIFISYPVHILYSIIYLLLNSRNKKLFFEIIVYLFIWKNFCNTYRRIKYISYQDFNISHIIKNIFLSKNKSISFLYKHTSSENIFDYKNKSSYSNTVFAFNCFDYEFHNFYPSIEMSKSNQSVSKKNIVTGPLWSSKEFNDNIILNKKNKESYIGVFNTSFSNNGVNSNLDHYKFLKFLKKISNNYPSLKFIFKSKYDYKSYINIDKIGNDSCKDQNLISELLLDLIRSRKFIFLNNKIKARTIINTCNIIISMSFASPGLESLFLKKKSFFVDISGNYNNSYFDNFEKIVSHSQNEAEHLFKYYLNESENNINKLLVGNKKEIFPELNDNSNPMDIIKRTILSSKFNNK